MTDLSSKDRNPSDSLLTQNINDNSNYTILFNIEQNESAMKTRINGISKTQENLIKDIDELKQQVLTKDELIRELSSKLEKLTGENSELSSSVETLQKTNQELNFKIKVLEDQSEKLQNKLNKLNRILRDLETENNKMKTEMKSLGWKFDKVERDNIDLKLEHENLRNEVGEVNTRLKSTQLHNIKLRDSEARQSVQNQRLLANNQQQQAENSLLVIGQIAYEIDRLVLEKVLSQNRKEDLKFTTVKQLYNDEEDLTEDEKTSLDDIKNLIKLKHIRTMSIMKKNRIAIGHPPLPPVDVLKNIVSASSDPKGNTEVLNIYNSLLN